MCLRKVFDLKRSFLFPLCIFLCICSGCSSLPRTAFVKWVVDGDTIVLDNGEKVRYLGIDTPEITSNQVWAEEAMEYNRSLVAGKYVRLEYDQIKRDRYNRLLAFVWIGKKMVNEELVREGLAYVYYIFPNEKYAPRLLIAQEESMKEKKGLWRYPGIVHWNELRRWKGYTRAVKGRICQVFSTGKGFYLLFHCVSGNWMGFYLPYSRFVGTDFEAYRGLVGKSVLGIGKVRCSREHCRVLILDKYQLQVEEEKKGI